MQSNIKISVIVPIYNSAQYLEDCLKSIVNQTYRDLEIILVNDGSTDCSEAICRKFAASDGRIILISQDNLGHSVARSAGMEKASGEYISFVDSDDIIESEMYSTIVSIVRKHNPDIIAFGLKEVYSDRIAEKKNKFASGFYDKKKLREEIFPSLISHGEFFEFGILPNQVCKLFERKLFDRIPLNVSADVKIGEDADFSFQCIAQADSIQILDITPYNYFRRNDSMMSNQIDVNSINSLEKDLKSCFMKNEACSVLMEQTNKYIKFVKALKRPDCVRELEQFFAKCRDGGCALYGAGGFGYGIYSVYKDKIGLWTDRNHTYYVNQKQPVVSVEELIDKSDLYDCIFVAILSVNVCKEIKKELKDKGIRARILFFDGNDITE